MVRPRFVRTVAELLYDTLWLAIPGVLAWFLLRRVPHLFVRAPRYGGVLRIGSDKGVMGCQP